MVPRVYLGAFLFTSSAIPRYTLLIMNPETRVRELEAENAQLRTENQAKSDFLSIIVHQLRTPLAATKWIFKMMMDGDFGGMTDEQKTIIQKGFASNEQMIRMLAEVSAMNHLSEWKLQVHPAPTDITSCIKGLLSEFSEEAKTKSIRISLTPTTPLPPVIADKDKVCIAIENLIENAIKYNKNGGSVTIHAEPFRDSLVISITDTGIGIPLNDQKNIFGKFFRAENAKQFQKGTGLGLFVVKQLIEANHGKVWFESTEGIGTTLFVSLPLARTTEALAK